MNVELSFIADIKGIIDNARSKVYAAINFAMVETNWLIGKRIVEKEQKGEERAEYGAFLLKELSKQPTVEIGEGFSAVNLKNYRKFYLTFNTYQKGYALRTQLQSIDNQQHEKSYAVHPLFEKAEMPLILRKELTWTHYRLLMRVENHLAVQEVALIDNLQQFLLELGKGFSFIKRQYRINTETKSFSIDLVFYNYILKCFVLFDLKTGELSHQDVSQMDMYVRLFDERQRTETDNPTIGIILCTYKDETIVKYSMLNGNEQLFATKYRLYLPTEEELIAEIEREKLHIEEKLRNKNQQ